MKKPSKAAKTAPVAASSPKKHLAVKSQALTPSVKTQPVTRVAKSPPSKPVAAKAAPVPKMPKITPNREERPSSSVMTTSDQTRLFEKAVSLFHAHEFSKAIMLFEQVAQGPGREMAHASRLHIRMCEHRLAKSGPELSSPEDRYNYAIALINRRELELAEQQLKQALQQTDEADHLHYAMALCRGLNGDLQGAYAHLKRAIELQPRNRLMARNDPDFHPFAHQAPIRELLFP